MKLILKPRIFKMAKLNKKIIKYKNLTFKKKN